MHIKYTPSGEPAKVSEVVIQYLYSLFKKLSPKKEIKTKYNSDVGFIHLNLKASNHDKP